MKSFNEIKENLLKEKGKLEKLNEELENKTLLLDQKQVLKPFLEQAQVFIQQTAKETQEQLIFCLEDIVQTGLDICFSEKQYKFKIGFENKRGKTEADIYLVDNQNNRYEIIDSNGGGLIDIVSFCLRMACWTIGKSDNLIILDEPFKFLSINLKPLAGELLKTLSEKLHLQILMITHDPEMKEIANKQFEII